MAITIPILSEFNDKGIQAAESAFQKVGDIAKKAAIAVGALAVGGAAAAGKAIDLASDLAESQAKVGEIFGTAAAEIEAFAATAATKLGQSKQDVLNAAGTFGIFGKAAGLSGKDLSTFSNDFTALASDLASFNNTSPQEAIDAIGAALRGESEPLRRYGVLLDDATLRQEALALGIYDGNGALTAQQKILAAQAAIYKQTADAQGDFERTSDGLANKQRILKAQLQNAATTIGTALLPIATKLFTFIGDRLVPIVEKLTSTFSEEGLGGVARMVGDQIPKVLDKLRELGSALIAWVGEQIPGWLEKLGELGQALLDWIGPRIKPMLEKLGELLGAAANWIIDEGVPMLVDKLIQLGNALVEWIGPNIKPMLKELGEWLIALTRWIITDAVPKLAEAALKLAGALLSWLAQLLPQALAGLATFLVDLIKALPGLFVDLIATAMKLGGDVGSAIVDGIVDGVKKLVDKGGDVAKQFVNAILGFINKQFIDRINDLLEFKIPIPMGPDININPPDIPRIPLLAEGGIVTGPTLAMIGEAGPEAVIPLNRSAMMGNITINVTGSVISEGDLVETVRRGLVKAQRNGAQLVYSNV